ncbi:MAG TPA: ABC transporter ATP-binding protein [Casimicrobiaceae bacterium]|nr:ABC transporter ATP-binding protein [Casimicrobiaceae bacterium]
MSAALVAIGLDFGYPEHPVGHAVSLSLAAGEVVCLLGPNGGGKTTFFKTLLGLIPRRGGEVRIDESDLTTLTRAEIARRVAYVPQANVGYFPFTVHEMAVMGRTAYISPFSGPSVQDRRIAMEALERVGIARLADQPYTRISGGERQLALIARALSQAAPLVVMDEPTASLDFGNQSRVLAVVRELAAHGTGVLFATHDPDHAFAIADRVAIFHDGRLIGDGPPHRTITPEALRTVYGIEVDVVDVATPQGARRVCLPGGRIAP